MNWLIWIGGYTIFSSLVNIVHGLEYYFVYGKLRDKIRATMFLDMVASLLIWIWICGKYLSN